MRSSYLEKLLGGEKRKGESAGIEGSYRAEGKGPGGRQSARSTWQKSLPLPSSKNSKVLRRRRVWQVAGSVTEILVRGLQGNGSVLI